MTLDRDRPEILQPPENPQACCTQRTLTVPPEVTAKTRQKHHYPSAAHRRSYTRRTGAERGFATARDPATNNISRGWCRLMGLTPLMLFTVTLLVVRNQRILTAWNARQADNTRRAAAGLPPKTRKRRRKTLTVLATATRPSRPARRTPEQHPHEHPGSARTLHADSGTTPGNHPAGAQEATTRTRTAQDHSGCTRAARVPECQT